MCTLTLSQVLFHFDILLLDRKKRSVDINIPTGACVIEKCLFQVTCLFTQNALNISLDSYFSECKSHI